MQIEFFKEIQSSKKVLIAGVGGAFDITRPQTPVWGCLLEKQ